MSFNLTEVNRNTCPAYLTADKTISLSSFNLSEANYNAYPDFLTAA